MSSSPRKTFKNPRARHNYQGRPCSIVGVGSYVPSRVLANPELERMVDTSDQWIITRTGIRERRVASPEEATSDLAAQAARRALAHAGVSPEQVDLLITATVTPDMLFPSTSCLVQEKIGASRAAAFDLEAACSGFIYALEVGQQFIMSQTYDTVLVIGAEKLTSIVDWTDRNTCVLFGDGAGAAVLQHRPGSHGLLTVCMGADGSKGNVLCVPAGGSRLPASYETVEKRLHFVQQEGGSVFKFAVKNTEEICRRILEKNGLTGADVDLFVSHQANRRIIDSAADRLGMDPAKVVINIERFGNTTAATIPLALQDAISDGRLKKGDLVLLASVGAGFTVGSVLLRWAY